MARDVPDPLQWEAEGLPVRVSREQVLANRDRVLSVASRLLRKHGIDGIGIDALMREAGLTAGGFYKSFASKDALVAEACERALADGAANWTSISGDLPDDPLGSWIDRYLSREHCESTGEGCAFASLAAEAGKRPGPVRSVFTAGLRASLSRLSQHVPGRTLASRRERAITTFATLVGTLVLARVVDDEAFRAEILAATRKLTTKKPRGAAEEARPSQA